MGTFREEYESKKKSHTESSFRERYEASRTDLNAVADSVRERTNTWLKNHYNYLRNYESRYKGATSPYREDWQNWHDTVKAQKNNFDAEAESIRSLLDRYAGKSKEWDSFAEGIKNILTAGRVDQSRVIEQSIQDVNFSGKFKSLEDFEKWDSGWLSEDATVDYDSAQKRKAYYEKNQNRIAEIKNSLPFGGGSWLPNWTEDIWLSEEEEKLRDEYEARTAEGQRYEREQKETDDYFRPATEEFKRNAANRDYGVLRLEDLEQYRWDDTEYLDSILNTQGKGLQDNIGFRDNGSIVRWAVDPETGEYVVDPKTGEYVKEVLVKSGRDFQDDVTSRGKQVFTEDKLGYYLTDPNERDAIASRLRAIDSQTMNTDAYDNIAGYYEGIVYEGIEGNWEFLKENEIDIYYDLLAREGKESAYAFLDAMKPTLHKRAAESNVDDIMNNKDPYLQLLYNVGSVPMNVVGGAMGFAEDAVASITGNEVDPYSHAHRWQIYAQAIRDKTAGDIDDATGNIAIPWIDFSAGDAYQSIMSAADSFVGAGTLGQGYSVLAGMGAASAKARELYDKGATKEQIVVGSALAGAAELVFEAIGIENLLKAKDAKNVKDVIFNALKQAGVEGLEEMGTEYTNQIWDAIIMGSQSDWVDFETFVQNVVNAGLGGFISGGVGGGTMAAAGSALQAADYQAAVKDHGQAITDFGDVESLQKHAEAMIKDKNTPNVWEIKQQLKKVQNNPSAKNVGRLSAAMSDSVRMQNRKENVQQLKKEGLSKKLADSVYNAILQMEDSISRAGSDTARLAAEQKFVDALAKMGLDDATQSAVAAVAQDLIENPQNASQSRLRELMNSRVNSVDPKDLEILQRRKEIPTEGRISSDGTTRLETTGETVQIRKEDPIAKIENGTVFLNTDKGVLETSDLQFANEEELRLYEAVSDLDAGTASVIVTGYDGNMPALDYVSGMEEGVLLYGKHGFQTVGKDISDKGYFAGLSEANQQTALALGRELRSEETRQRTARVREAIERAKEEKRMQYDAAPVNEEIMSLVEKGYEYLTKPSKEDNVSLGVVSDEIAIEIENLTGVNVEGFEIMVEARQLAHILKRHGENGKADSSMKDPADIAKMEYVLSNPDDISYAGKTNAYWHNVNGKNKTADTVLYEKNIGEKSYYVVQAVPDTKAKALYVVTAFIGKVGQKKEALLLTDAKNPGATSKNVATNASTVSIPQNDPIVKTEGKIFFDDSVELSELTKKQRAEVEYAGNVISAAIGNEIHFFDSRHAPADSREAKTNGWYDPKDGSIHLDIAKVENGEESVLFTLSHELVHFIEDWSPAKYQTFADFLLKNYADHDVKTESLVRRKMADLKTTDYDYAMSEVVADACERMLLDSNASEKLAELSKTDKGLVAKIKSFLANTLKKIRQAYAQYKGREEAQLLQKMEDKLSKFYALFEDALTDAAQNYRDADGMLHSVKNANVAVFGTDMVSEEQDFSVKDQLKENGKIGAAAIAYNDRHNKVNAAVLKVGVDTMMEMANTMLPYLDEEGILPPDLPGKTLFKNGSYGRTGENTTVCVRTLTYEDFKDRVADELGRPLTVAESLLVSQKIYDIATDPQCIYCYVAADRKAYDEYLGEYWKAMDKYVRAMRRGGDPEALYKEYLDGRKDTSQQQKRWAMWKSLAKSGKPYISAKDLATRANRDRILDDKNGPFADQVRDAKRYAQSASWAKTVYDYRAYKGDILKMSQKLIDTLNSEYGLRMYSFSDYTPAFIVENMQMIIDASARGLKSLAYSKDTDYVKIFAPTGQAINVSCFAKYDSKTGTYVEDNRQGASWSETKDLRKKHRNVGAVMVCTNDAMVEWALKQDWIDIVIPYHIVKTGTTIANEYDWRNYTAESADRKGNRTANIYPTEHNNDFATYQKLLQERDITPRFERFYQKALSGEITSDQYMKLVNEVRLPASELSPVLPMFDLAAARQSFGINEDGSVIPGGFVDKGGYMGGWYRAGVDVNQEVLAVKKDIVEGKTSLDVDYGMNKKVKMKQIEINNGVRMPIREQAKRSYSEYGSNFHQNSEIYSYDFLTSQDPMKVLIAPAKEDVFTNGRIDRDKVLITGKKNALALKGSTLGKDGAVLVINRYTKKPIAISEQSIKHGLGGKPSYFLTNARLGMIIGEIVQNGIPLNELTPSAGADSTYAMGAYVASPEGRDFLAIAHIDVRSGNVVSYQTSDLVHSLRGRIKKGSPVAIKSAPASVENHLTVVASDISIAQFLEFVNSTNQSLLSNDVLKHFGEARKSEGTYYGEVKYQQKQNTTREILANADLNAIDLSNRGGDQLAAHLKDYQEKEKELKKHEAKVRSLSEDILRMRKAREDGKPYDSSKMDELLAERNRESILASQLRRSMQLITKAPEVSKFVEREKLTAWRQNRDEIERGKMERARVTELKHRARKKAETLNKMLTKPTKKIHVKSGLQKAVASFLYALNLDTVNYESRIKFLETRIKFAEREIEEELKRSGITKKNAEAFEEQFSARVEKRIREITASKEWNELRNMSMLDKISDLRKGLATYMEEENIAETPNRKMILELLDRNSVFLEVSAKQRIEDLKTKIENEEDPVERAYLSVRLEMLNQQKDFLPLGAMSLGELQVVDDSLSQVLAMVRDANKVFDDNKAMEAADASDAARAEVKLAKKPREIENRITEVGDAAFWSMLMPETAFHLIGSDTLVRLYEDITDGSHQWGVLVDRAHRYFAKTAERYNYLEWRNDDTLHSFQSSNGKTFQLNLQEIMSLYAYSRRGDQALDHIINGGVVKQNSMVPATKTEEKNGKEVKIPFGYKPESNTAYKISRETLSRMFAVLTPEQKKFVEDMQKYLSEDCSEQGNKTSLILYGIRLFKEKIYFPIRTWSEAEAFDPDAGGDSMIVNSSFTKATIKGATRAIVLDNFETVWAKHTEEMARYATMSVPIENFLRVWNVKSASDLPGNTPETLSTVIRARWGANASEYVRKFISDVNGGARKAQEKDPLDRALSKTKKAAVVASLSVAIQQPSSIARAAAYIDPKYMVKGSLKNIDLREHEQRWEEAKKYAPVAITKEMGGFDTGVGKGTVDWILSYEYGNVKERICDALKDPNRFRRLMKESDDVFGWLPSFMDEISWGKIWFACKRQVAAEQGLRIDSEKCKVEAGKLFTMVINRTQVYDSSLVKSGLMRNGTLGAKLLSQFAAEPTVTVNMHAMGIVEASRNGKSGKKFFHRTNAAILCSKIINAALVAVIYALRDDDEDETLPEKYLEHFIEKGIDELNPLNSFPILRDINSWIQGFSSERPDADLAADLIYTTKQWWSDEKSVLEKLRGSAESLSSMFGIPVKNILRDADAVARGFSHLFGSYPRQTTGQGLSSAMYEALPFAKADKGNGLYRAYVSGDAAQIERYRSNYDSAEKWTTAVRTALKENDPRILQAAIAQLNGNASERVRIQKEIIGEGDFSQDLIVTATNGMVTSFQSKIRTASEAKRAGKDKDYAKIVKELQKAGYPDDLISKYVGEKVEALQKEEEAEAEAGGKATSWYRSSDVADAYASGDEKLALEIINDLIRVKTANSTEEKAEDKEKTAKSSVKSIVTEYWKPRYKEAHKNGNQEEMKRIRYILKDTGLYGSVDELVKTCNRWLNEKE